MPRDPNDCAANEAETFWTVLGFERECTGGNCDAFRYNYADERYILVTVDDEPMAPETTDEPVNVTLYGPDDGTDASAESLDAFFGVDSENAAATLDEMMARDPRWMLKE